MIDALSAECIIRMHATCMARLVQSLRDASKELAFLEDLVRSDTSSGSMSQAEDLRKHSAEFSKIADDVSAAVTSLSAAAEHYRAARMGRN